MRDLKINLIAKKGHNSLILKGSGVSDSYGVTVSEVKLRFDYDHEEN